MVSEKLENILLDRIEKALLDYFAKDDGDTRTFQSLTTVYEKVNQQEQWRESALLPFDELSKNELKDILDQMVIDDLLDVELGEQTSDPSYRATDQGLYETVLGRNDYLAQRPSIKPIEFNPDDWTGPQSIYVDGKAWGQVKNTAIALQLRCRTTNFYSVADEQDIQGLADALVALCQMAEPELSLIDKITAHPKFKAYAALTVFVATIRGALGI